MLCSTKLLTDTIHFHVTLIMLDFIFQWNSLSLCLSFSDGSNLAWLTALFEVMIIKLVMCSIGYLGCAVWDFFKKIGLFSNHTIEDAFEIHFGGFFDGLTRFWRWCILLFADFSEWIKVYFILGERVFDKTPRFPRSKFARWRQNYSQGYRTCVFFKYQ